MKIIKKRCLIYDIGDVVKIYDFDVSMVDALRSPDFFVIVSKTDDCISVVPAWNSKISHSLWLYSFPSKIYVKPEYLFDVNATQLTKEEIFNLKNKDDAINLVLKRHRQIAKRKYKQRRNSNNRQLRNISGKLDYNSGSDMIKISNVKACQGGRVIPK